MSTLRGTDLLSEAVEPIAKVICETLGVNTELAQATSIEITTQLAHLWGGQVVYIPKGVYIEASRLHQKIYNDFNGHNLHQLASKHGVSIQHVYNVIKRQRKASIPRKRGDLFQPDTDK